MPIKNYSPSLGIQVTELMMGIYHDRGDPAAPDFVGANLVVDMAWHELDLSSIVPEAGANHLVHLMGFSRWVDGAGAEMRFRKVGNIHEVNMAWTIEGPVAKSASTDMWVMLNADRKIEYNVNAPELSNREIMLLVRGWVTD